ncbi:MAG: SufD family Fe-S cluster assembly protein [Oscillospiraceae bacterium]|jgi:Fe-S cluster assembly scaffold protein SufB|nr:SufD family Fe-S cluster assembly protein [Oscillospiraceae bacterium]
MEIKLKELNALPVRTWHRLGVNGNTVETSADDTLSYSVTRSALPDIVTETNAEELRCAEFRTAVGEEATEYIRRESNAGVRVRARRGYEVEKPVTARYSLRSGALLDDNIIFAEAGSSLTVVLIFDAFNGKPCFHGGSTRIIAENCATVNLIQIQTLNNASTHISDVSAIIGNGASVNVTQIELGGASATVGCHLKLEGNTASARADTFYFGNGDRRLDFNYIARHLGDGTTSSLTASGALFDRCDKTYRGTLDFIRGAAGSKGAEIENTLLFSPDARNRSAPLILCEEEDVEGSHAASIGKIDANKLYYMQSRGLSEVEAKRLLVTAQLETVLKNVPGEEERERLRDYLSGRIKANALR